MLALISALIGLMGVGAAVAGSGGGSDNSPSTPDDRDNVDSTPSATDAEGPAQALQEIDQDQGSEKASENTPPLPPTPPPDTTDPGSRPEPPAASPPSPIVPPAQEDNEPETTPPGADDKEDPAGGTPPVAADDQNDDAEAPEAPETGEETSGPCPKTGAAVCTCDQDEDDTPAASGPCPKTGDPVCNCHNEHDDAHHSEPTIPVPPAGADAATIEAYVQAVKDSPENSDVHADHAGAAGEHAAVLDLVPRDEATHIAVSDGDWFDQSTWHNGEIPGDNAKVLIPEGITVEYDQVSDTELFTLRVDGELDFATDADSSLIVDTFVVSPSGTLTIGTEQEPVQADVDVNIVFANNGPIDTDWDPTLISRGLISQGKVNIHGQEKDSHEKVSEDPLAGDTSLTFEGVPDGWQVGDTIVVAGTRYHGHNGRNTEFSEPQDEVRIISSIEGNTIHFEEPLLYDHDSPREDLHTSVANYTRNVSFETQDAELAEISERGHVVFMHSNEIDVRFAEFSQLGRTDKSEESFDISDIKNVESDSNVQGRYSLHLHRTGVNDDPAIVEGNAVFGSPGWGFVHHDSNAILDNNASYDTFGAGFVAETGNETGAWNDNIAIFAKGVSWEQPKNDTIANQDQFDTARTGDGFWFQGRLVDSTNNIAASVNTGFVYFHRDGDDRLIDISSEQFALPDALLRTEVAPDDAPILNFDGNETFAAREGLHVVKASPNQGHDVASTLDNFTAWSVTSGAHLEYTSHYILSNFDLIANDTSPFGNSSPDAGISFGNNTSDVVITDAKIDGFSEGIDLRKHYVRDDWEANFDHFYVVVDADISNVGQEYANYDPSEDTITSRAALQDVKPDLELSGPLLYREREGPDDSDARSVIFSGTKTDSIGEVPFPAGTDTIKLSLNAFVDTLETDGYWTTSDGDAYALVDVYLTDRLTGDIYYETHPVFIADNVRLENPNTVYADAKNNGEQDLVEVNGQTYAGDKILDTAILALQDGNLAIEQSETLSAYEIPPQEYTLIQGNQFSDFQWLDNGNSTQIEQVQLMAESNEGAVLLEALLQDPALFDSSTIPEPPANQGPGPEEELI